MVVVVVVVVVPRSSYLMYSIFRNVSALGYCKQRIRIEGVECLLGNVKWIVAVITLNFFLLCHFFFQTDLLITLSRLLSLWLGSSL